MKEVVRRNGFIHVSIFLFNLIYLLHSLLPYSKSILFSAEWKSLSLDTLYIHLQQHPPEQAAKHKKTHPAGTRSYHPLLNNILIPVKLIIATYENRQFLCHLVALSYSPSLLPRLTIPAIYSTSLCHRKHGTIILPSITARSSG